MKKVVLPDLFLVLLSPAGPSLLLAQQPGALETGYQLPPKAIVDILDAPPPPTAVVSPTRDTLVLLERRSMPPIAELARPMLPLAGLRLDPGTNGPHRRPDVAGLTVRPIDGGAERRLTVPAGATVMTIASASVSAPSARSRAFGAPERRVRAPGGCKRALFAISSAAASRPTWYVTCCGVPCNP